MNSFLENRLTADSVASIGFPFSKTNPPHVVFGWIISIDCSATKPQHFMVEAISAERCQFWLSIPQSIPKTKRSLHNGIWDLCSWSLCQNENRGKELKLQRGFVSRNFGEYRPPTMLKIRKKQSKYTKWFLPTLSLSLSPPFSLSLEMRLMGVVCASWWRLTGGV